jgi:hypothetical protein
MEKILFSYADWRIAIVDITPIGEYLKYDNQ